MDEAERRQRAIDAIDQGRAGVRLPHFRVLEVSGSDAEGWLNDLVTAGIAGLQAGNAVESLLLDPTGHIRAHFSVTRTGAAFVLLQDEAQADLATLLDRYILSAQVHISDRTKAAEIVAVPEACVVEGATWESRPSVSGVPAFRDVCIPSGEPTAGRLAGLGSTPLLGPEELEWERVAAGRPRFLVDVDVRSIPAEAGWDRTLVDATKGCFLGQESVARVRNLGHPPRRVVALTGLGPIRTGEEVLDAAGAVVGRITSAVRLVDRTAAIASIGWAAQGPWATADEGPLTLA
jgi:folate-binding protein YgfZ